MPVEIRELIVRATIAEDLAQDRHDMFGTPGSNEAIFFNEQTKQLIIEEAVQHVLLILERQKDR